MSRADRSLYRKAQAKGTVFKSRTEAKKAFARKYGSKYTSRFPTKPKTRPDYIPKTTTVGGRTVPIDYNPRYGGYGYFGPGGKWIFYSALADAAMTGMLMRRHCYYWGAPPVYYGGVGNILWTGLVIFGVIFVLALILKR